MSGFQETKNIELLEVLAGTRPGERKKAAVRIEDLSEILQLRKMKSDSVTAAPTADQHNALVADIREIFTRLDAIALALQKRTIR